MATSDARVEAERGSALLGASAPARPGSPELSSGRRTAVQARRPKCSSFGQKWAPSLPSRSFRGTESVKLRSASLTTIESLPWEVLLHIFTYLDVSSLFCAGCVNRTFYNVSNDNLMWHRIYSSYFAYKSKVWKPKAVDATMEKLSRTSIQDSPPRFWKKEFIHKCSGSGTRGVGLLLKPINRYTGLPSKIREAVKALGLTWMIVLHERMGREHVQEQSKAFFSDTSATIYWNSAVWPPLSSLKTLCVYGVTPLFPPNKTPAKHGPRRRSLLVEYDLTTLEESSSSIGGDKLIKLRCLHPGMLLGCWQEDGELALIVTNLHYHQLIEKSTLGSVTSPYRQSPHEPVLDDVVSEYGLLGYHCHITLHNGKSSYMSGSFHNLFCRKEYIQNGFLQIIVISLEKESQHGTISGSIHIPWNTGFLRGKIQFWKCTQCLLLTDKVKELELDVLRIIWEAEHLVIEIFTEVVTSRVQASDSRWVTTSKGTEQSEHELWPFPSEELSRSSSIYGEESAVNNSGKNPDEGSQLKHQLFIPFHRRCLTCRVPPAFSVCCSGFPQSDESPYCIVFQHCCLMDVTVLDEAEKPFWCVSSAVALQTVPASDIRYRYLGKRQTIDYKDHEGKVHMELMWLEEEQQYYVVNLVLYLTVEKVNAWFATSY